MLVIRLTRKGKKNQPFFRIVVTDKRRSAKGGRAVEELGYVNPLTKKNSINKERVLHWLKVGAKASPRVHNLLVSEKIISAKKINVYKKSKKVAAAVVAPAAGTGASASAEASARTDSVPAQETKAPEPVIEVSDKQQETSDKGQESKVEARLEPAKPTGAPKEEPKPEEKLA